MSKEMSANPRIVHDLKIQNPKSSIAEIYSSSAAYNIVLELFDFSNDSLDTSYFSQHGSFQEDYRISTEIKNRPLHRHDFYEFMFVLNGTCIQRIENLSYSYQKGQCCLLNPNVKHAEEPSSSCELVFLTVTEDFFQALIKNDISYTDNGSRRQNQNILYRMIQEQPGGEPRYQKKYMDFFPVAAPDDAVMELAELLRNLIMETQMQKPANLFFVQGTIARLIAFLTDRSKYIARQVDLKNSKEEFIFTQIQRLIEESHGRIGREELSERLNYDDHYLNRIAKRQTGVSLKQYGQLFLLQEAARRLSGSSASISEIIRSLGLSNHTYFYRIFKEQYGVTPQEYRRRMSGAASEFSIL